MGKLTYERTENDLEPSKITLDIEDELSIWEFKVVCKRLASAIGYHYESIIDAFGDETKEPTETIAHAGMQDMLNVNPFFDIDTPSGSAFL